MGRKVAKSMGIRVRGSIGVLLHGYDKGLLSADDVDAATDKMKEVGRRISEKLYQYAYEYVRK